MDADLGPEADAEMATLDNRLPYMDREQLCKEHGFTAAIKWLPCRSKNRTDADGNRFNGLKPDPNDYHGKFGELSLAWELMQGEGLPGKCAADPDNVHHISNLQETSDDPRTKEAKECGVTGAFAVFRDGAVWEFVQEKPMDAAPTALVDTFGGSTGTAVMTAALAAIKLRSKMGKFSKKKATAGVTDMPKGTPDYDPMSAVSKS